MKNPANNRQIRAHRRSAVPEMPTAPRTRDALIGLFLNLMVRTLRQLLRSRRRTERSPQPAKNPCSS